MDSAVSQIICMVGEEISNVDGEVLTTFTCNCIDAMKTDQNQEKIKSEILDPLIKYMGCRIWPYIVFAGILFTVMTIILCICVIQLVKLKGTECSVKL